MVPAFLMAALVLAYDYRQQREELIRESIASARNLIRLVDRDLAMTQATLDVLAASPSLLDRDYAAFRRQAQQVLKRGFINNIALIDSTGQQLVNTAISYGAALPKTGVMSQVQRVLQSGQPEVSGLVTGAALNRQLISVLVPVYTGEIATHAISGVILPEHFAHVMDGQGLPADRIAVLFDHVDKVVARSHQPAQYVGKSIASGLSERLKQIKEGTFEVVTLEGVPVQSTFSRSTKTGWGVAIGITQDSLTRDLRRTTAALLVIMALLIGLGILGAWRMGGRISRAIGALQAPARQLGRGEQIQMPSLDIREVHELGEELKNASAILQTTRGALEDNDARFRGVVESAMDAIIAVDASQVILMFNAAAETMFACPASQAIGMPLSRFITERFHAHTAEVFHREERPEQAGKHGTGRLDGVTDELMCRRLNGEEFPAEVSFSMVRKSGHRLHTLIVRDVTSRVRAYKALERSNLDLQQFAYVASHDLKTPLRSIGGFVQLLEREYSDKLDEKALTLIHRTTAATKRLEQLTEDLLSYARIETSAAQFVTVDMAEVVQDVIQMLEAVIQSSGATVSVGSLPKVHGDRTQLAQLLMNLLANGIKYCRDPHPLVELSAELQNGEWEFSVKDNGIGIDARHHEKVFEVFKRLHGQNEYPGTGIGLAICKRVVENHGGKIWVGTHVGPGTTFKFTLPAAS
ncbi:MAG: ATP-binding protein [Pseudomonadota bacterium]